MGEKKKKEAATKLWKKILVVGACILFAVLMVLSGMGTGWLSMFTAVKSGDSVVIDYTLFDAGGKPIVTSEKSTYDQAVAQNRQIFGSGRLTITSNQTTEKPIFSVPVYPSAGTGVQQLGIFSIEYNSISSGIVGLKINEQKKIPLFSSIPMKQEWSAEQLALSKINISDISPGDNFFMGISDNLDNGNVTPADTYLRIGEVVNKSSESVIIDFSYPAIDVRVVSINNR